ncbi:uncharacterized protein LOC142338497 isoform X2 [Convolutriloba macropyga]|uniref:uncharacterized protein LOC142338497 isoform X2 n=1 Tax=Convolutriloba macropyga TaxID=536237 RepID=UPI003F5249E3
MIRRPYQYARNAPGYPVIRIRFGVDYDIYAADSSIDWKIGNSNGGLCSFLWLAIVLPLTLFLAWCIVETLIAYVNWMAAEEIRKKTRKQIEKFPEQIKKLDPNFKLMEKKRFMSASCYHAKPPDVHPVCKGGSGGNGFGEEEEDYIELMARVEFNAKDHRTRHVTGCLVLAATFNNKELLKGIVVTGLAKVGSNMGRKGVIEVYEENEIIFHLTSSWFLTAYFDEVIPQREDSPLPAFWFFLFKLNEMTKMGYLGSVDPKFLPSEYCLYRDDIYYYPIEVEAFVDEEQENIEDMVFLSCDNIHEATRRLTRRVYGTKRASAIPPKLKLFMQVEKEGGEGGTKGEGEGDRLKGDDDKEDVKHFNMHVMATRFQDLTNQVFHFGDLLLPEKPVFYLKPEKVAQGMKDMNEEDYDKYIMCDQIRDPDRKDERRVTPLPGDRAVEKARAHILPHVVFLFDTILRESEKSGAVRLLLILCNQAGSQGKNAEKLQKAVLGHCWMILISNMHHLIDQSMTDGAKKDLEYIGKCFAECLWDKKNEFVSEYKDLLISLEGLESLIKARRGVRTWRPKGTKLTDHDEEDEDEYEEQQGSQADGKRSKATSAQGGSSMQEGSVREGEEEEYGDKRKKSSKSKGKKSKKEEEEKDSMPPVKRRPMLWGEPVYDGEEALELLNAVFETHSDEIPEDGKKRKPSSVKSQAKRRRILHAKTRAIGKLIFGKRT